VGGSNCLMPGVMKARERSDSPFLRDIFSLAVRPGRFIVREGVILICPGSCQSHTEDGGHL
jgi:hypothetical protein